MKKFLSLLIFGGLFFSFNCHNTAFAEMDHGAPIPRLEISGYQTGNEVKNCCDSLLKVSPAVLQKKVSDPSLAVLLPAFSLEERFLAEFSRFHPAATSFVSTLPKGLLSTVKRE